MTVDRSIGLEPLASYHDAVDFDCGVPVLNAYLMKRALGDQRAGRARIYVALRGDYIVGYFSLLAASVRRQETLDEALEGEAAAVPVILLSRLAVDADEQGQGLGSRMLAEAMARAAQAAEVIDGRAVLVHAKNEAARSFYERHGLRSSPFSPLHLMLSVSDLRRTFAA